MQHHAEEKCDEHPDRFECVDLLIHYSPKFDLYGIMIHDGGSAVIVIKYCPWCGAKLRDLSEQYFDILDALGFEKYDDPRIPPEFESAKWWIERKL